MPTIDVSSLPQAGEPRLHYYLLRRKVGVPTLSLYLRTVWGILGWFLLLPLVARLLGRLGARRALHIVARWWARGVTRYLQIRLDIKGLEHIDPQQAYIVAPLHEGFADVLTLLHLPLRLRFAARDELFGTRILGPLLRDTGQLFVAPERGAWSYRALHRAARDVFACGESLVLFPQGTILGIEADFRSGAFALARALRRPILPIALTGGHRVWEHPYTPRLRYGQRISMWVFAPIPVEEIEATGVEPLRQATQRQLKAAALGGAMAPPRRFVPARDGYWDGYAYRIDPEFPDLLADIARHRAQHSGHTAGEAPHNTTAA